MITLITAIDPNNVIGNAGKTPWHIPDELKLFKEITYGHAIIVGRKTYESIGHALPGRRMFVLSRSVLPLTKGELEGVETVRTTPPSLPLVRGGDIVFCSSIENALEKTKNERTVFVIGGGQVYDEFMPIADELRISFIHNTYEGDVRFPEISSDIWKPLSKTEYELFTHIHYVRNEQSSKNR